MLAPVADDAGAAIVDLETGVLVEEAGDLGLNRLREQGTRPIAKDFRELVVEGSWLNQSDDVIVGHGISLLCWRSGGVKHPHDMPPSRSTPSPTSDHSSRKPNAPAHQQPLYHRCFNGCFGAVVEPRGLYRA